MTVMGVVVTFGSGGQYKQTGFQPELLWHMR